MRSSREENSGDGESVREWRSSSPKSDWEPPDKRAMLVLGCSTHERRIKDGRSAVNDPIIEKVCVPGMSCVLDSLSRPEANSRELFASTGNRLLNFLAGGDRGTSRRPRGASRREDPRWKG